MPPKSVKQMKTAGMAYGASKAGKKVPSKGPAAQMQKSMGTKTLKEFASAPQGTAKLPMKAQKPHGRTVSE